MIQSCPRCGSDRIRKGYRQTPLWRKILLQHNLICDNCNWEFTGYAVGEIPEKPTRGSGNVKLRTKKLDSATANNRLIQSAEQKSPICPLVNESPADLATAEMFAEAERPDLETAELFRKSEESEHNAHAMTADSDKENTQSKAESAISNEANALLDSAQTPSETDLNALKMTLPNNNLVSLNTSVKRRKKTRRSSR